jgi:hypothetical protein
MLQALALSRDLLLYCDFHGHSVASNFMMYGNDELEGSVDDFAAPVGSDDPSISRSRDWLRASAMDAKSKLRIFPTLVSRRAPTLFSLDQCTFKVQKSREGTSRV